MSTADTITRQIEEGKTAERVLAAAGPMLVAREDQIITEMLRWFRSIQDGIGQNDPHIAMRYIASLSEVRALLEENEHRVAKGTDAMAKFMAQQQGRVLNGAAQE